MSILKSLFGSVEDKERQWEEAWRRVSDMPPAQLIDIIEARPNTPYGFLACVVLSEVAPNELPRLLQKDENLASSLSNWKRVDALLLGKGADFDHIRSRLKAIAASMQPLL